jgi:outer membrane protein assembly factor BamB
MAKLPSGLLVVSGSSYAAGQRTPQGTVGTRGFVMAVDPADGRHVWRQEFGQFVSRVTVAGDGGLVAMASACAGEKIGDSEATGPGCKPVLVVLTAEGSVLAIRPGGTGYEPGALATNAAGDTLLTSRATDPDQASGELVTRIAASDRSGHELWSQRVKGPLAQITAAAADGNEFLVAGVVEGSAEFADGTKLTSDPDFPHSSSAFLIRMSADGHTMWSRTFRSVGISALVTRADGTIVLGGGANYAPTWGRDGWLKKESAAMGMPSCSRSRRMERRSGRDCLATRRNSW